MRRILSGLSRMMLDAIIITAVKCNCTWKIITSNHQTGNSTITLVDSVCVWESVLGRPKNNPVFSINIQPGWDYCQPPWQAEPLLLISFKLWSSSVLCIFFKGTLATMGTIAGLVMATVCVCVCGPVPVVTEARQSTLPAWTLAWAGSAIF